VSVIRFVERRVAFVSRKSKSKTKIAVPSVSGQALFGPPLLLEGEDAAAYDEFLARIRAAVDPVDIIDDMFIADVVSLEWEVLRWRRVRCARHQFLTRTLAEPYYDSRANAREKVAMLGRLLGKDPPDVPLDALVSVVTSTPQAPHKLATILSQEAKQLLAMDRYERRLSRRKFAIRAFDAARRQGASAGE
jgi:hypothetical protein